MKVLCGDFSLFPIFIKKCQSLSWYNMINNMIINVSNKDIMVQLNYISADTVLFILWSTYCQILMCSIVLFLWGCFFCTF